MPNNHSTTQFTNAIVRRPAWSVVDGLRAVDIGAPDFLRLKDEHAQYVNTLRAAGLKVDILPGLQEFPDSVFVEDPALTFPGGAVLLRPGAQSRRFETFHLTAALSARFDTILKLPKPGFVEGGDVLRTPEKIMIGLSVRTDIDGALGLVTCLKQLGLKGEIVQTPENVLHFKTDCSLLDDETVFTTKRLAMSGVFEGFKTVLVPDGEEAAANALRANDILMIGDRFPKTIELLDSLGYNVLPLPTSEIGKVDAGLSCMSLRW